MPAPASSTSHAPIEERPLVTGACGFAGSHLVELLAGRRGIPVDGTYRPASDPIPPMLHERLRPHALDVNDAAQCREVLAKVRPSHIFHLAGPAHIAESFARPSEFARSVFGGTVNILEAAASLAPPPRVLLVSSCEVYGEAADLVFPTPLRDASWCHTVGYVSPLLAAKATQPSERVSPRKQERRVERFADCISRVARKVSSEERAVLPALRNPPRCLYNIFAS